MVSTETEICRGEEGRGTDKMDGGDKEVQMSSRKEDAAERTQ